MKSLELQSIVGVPIESVLGAFDSPLREAIADALRAHRLFEEGVDLVAVSGKWLRTFIGHVAVDADALGEFRRHYPPLTDRDQIFIRRSP